MPDVWFISDTHFFHHNILTFETGRKEFSCLDDMHETIIERWNAHIKPKDIVHHLGDVTFRYDGPFNELMSRLNGEKYLLLGNHDKLQNGSLQRWFQRVDLWSGKRFQKYGFVTSHIPLRYDQLRNVRINVHGHTHRSIVTFEGKIPDKRYVNVCVENTQYCPVNLDEIRAHTEL
jgi:calcineurin-like phosphoesterase family protein